MGPRFPPCTSPADSACSITQPPLVARFCTHDFMMISQNVCRDCVTHTTPQFPVPRRCCHNLWHTRAIISPLFSLSTIVTASCGDSSAILCVLISPHPPPRVGVRERVDCFWPRCANRRFFSLYFCPLLLLLPPSLPPRLLSRIASADAACALLLCCISYLVHQPTIHLSLGGFEHGCTSRQNIDPTTTRGSSSHQSVHVWMTPLAVRQCVHRMSQPLSHEHVSTTTSLVWCLPCMLWHGGVAYSF